MGKCHHDLQYGCSLANLINIVEKNVFEIETNYVIENVYVFKKNYEYLKTYFFYRRVLYLQ